MCFISLVEDDLCDKNSRKKKAGQNYLEKKIPWKAIQKTFSKLG